MEQSPHFISLGCCIFPQIYLCISRREWGRVRESEGEWGGVSGSVFFFILSFFSFFFCFFVFVCGCLGVVWGVRGSERQWQRRSGSEREWAGVSADRFMSERKNWQENDKNLYLQQAPEKLNCANLHRSAPYLLEVPGRNEDRYNSENVTFYVDSEETFTLSIRARNSEGPVSSPAVSDPVTSDQLRTYCCIRFHSDALLAVDCITRVDVTAPQPGPRITGTVAINSTCVKLSWLEPQFPNRLIGYRVGGNTKLVSSNISFCEHWLLILAMEMCGTCRHMQHVCANQWAGLH